MAATRLLWLALLSVTISYAADDIARDVRDLTIAEVLTRDDVHELPFAARDVLLLKVSPTYGKLPPAEAFGLIRDYEKRYVAPSGKSPLQSFIWYEGCDGCDHFYANGLPYFSIAYGPLVISASVSKGDKYVQAYVHAALADDSKVSVDILPENVRLAETDPKVRTFEQPKLKDVAKSVRKGAGWKAALVGGLGGMATRTVTTQQNGTVNGNVFGTNGMTTYNGTYRGQSTTQVPDYQARANAQARAAQMRAEADARSQAVVDTALLRNTLNPGQTTDGYVYFKDAKKTQNAVLQVIVGTVSLEFPIAWEE